MHGSCAGIPILGVRVSQAKALAPRSSKLLEPSASRVREISSQPEILYAGLASTDLPAEVVVGPAKHGTIGRFSIIQGLEGWASYRVLDSLVSSCILHPKTLFSFFRASLGSCTLLRLPTELACWPGTVYANLIHPRELPGLPGPLFQRNTYH